METDEFKDVFVPLARLMYVEAIRILRNQADAEDTVQDVFTRLWEHRDDLELIKNPKAFALVMIRNQCLNIINSVGYNKAVIGGQISGHATFMSSDPNDEIERVESIGTVMKLIESLPDNQRNVIKMHDVEGLSKQEIARITGLSPDNIRQLLSRARKAIRNHFSSPL